MTAGLSAIVLQSQQFFGYWGIGDRANVDTLIQAISAEMPAAQQLRSRPADHPSAIQPGWELVVSKCPVDLSNERHSLHCVTVGTAASGQPSHDRSRWDAEVQVSADRLTLQRDPFGRFPLYWLHQEQVIWFSTRWQWLLRIHPDFTINIPAVYGYACFSYVPTPFTPVSGITNLPAGTQQTWTIAPTAPILTATHAANLWNWQETTEQITDEAIAIAQLQTLLQQAIQTQIADLQHEPVGVFLSGGLDSSIVAALLVQAGLKVRAYTLDFGEVGIPEYPYAEQVAEFLNIPIVKVKATPRHIRRALVPTAQALDLPFGDGVTVPLFLLAEAASQEVGVVFNGEGGDQLFAGWTNKPLIAAGVYAAEHPQAEPFIRQYLRTFHRLWGYESQMFQPSVLAEVRTLNPELWLIAALDAEACPSLLHRLRRATLMLKGAQNIHPRATHLALAHGLQVRSPFCYLPLAHWAFQLSSLLHLQGSCEKYVLKRAVEHWLPEEIVWRTKRGMGVPLTAWCFHELWHDLGIWLNPAQLRQGGIWQPNLAHQLVTGQLGTIQGRRIGESLWLLLMWQVWQQTIGGKRATGFSYDHPFWLPSWLGRIYCRLQKGLE